MANAFTPKDAHTLMNLLAKEVTGQNPTIQAVDASSFVACAETVLSNGTENVLNALGIVTGKILMDARSYEGKFKLITATNGDMFTNVIRKISYYSKNAVEAGNLNTDLYTNLKDGYNNGTNGGQSTMDMFEQSQSYPLTIQFSGEEAYQYPITIYDYQLKTAFRNEEEFGSFVTGIMTEAMNDITTLKEGKTRLALLNFIGERYTDKDTLGTAVNMTAQFNSKFGTSYTTAELLGVYQSDFLKFFVAYVKTLSDKMTNRSKKLHWSPKKEVGGVSYSLLRHTPKANQKLFLYQPFMNEAETQVLSEVFSPNYLKIENYEGIDFWQNEAEPTKVKIIPAVTDINEQSPTYGTKIAGSEVAIDYVLGALFDTNALMVDNKLDTASTSPYEARKHYRTTWYSFVFGVQNDITNNGIVFYMAD